MLGHTTYTSKNICTHSHIYAYMTDIYSVCSLLYSLYSSFLSLSVSIIYSHIVYVHVHALIKRISSAVEVDILRARAEWNTLQTRCYLHICMSTH